MSQVVVRQAEPGDARELAGIRWDVKADGADLDRATREAFIDRQTTWFTLAMAGDWTVFVAQDGLDLCGQVLVRVVDKAPSPLPGATVIGYVTNFCVTPPRRDEGIDGRLLDAMRSWAERVPLEALVVWASDESVPDYERAGFRGDEVLQLLIS